MYNVRERVDAPVCLGLIFIYENTHFPFVGHSIATKIRKIFHLNVSSGYYFMTFTTTQSTVGLVADLFNVNFH